MTVATETFWNVSTGNGVTSVFSFSFPVTQKSDVVVLLDGAVAAGNYVVTFTDPDNPLGGGNVTFETNFEPASGVEVLRIRRLEYLQATSLPSQGAFNAQTVERAFDYVTMLTQQIAKRALLASDTALADGFTGAISGTLSAGAIPQLNSGLTGLEWVQNNGASSVVTATGGSVARSLANWFRGYGRDAEQPATLGHFTDKGDGVLIHRLRDRVFIADFNDDDGSTTGADSQTWIADESLGDWIPRSASLGVHSPIGGIAVHGAARVSDRYKVNGVAVAPWVTATVYAAGAYSARAGKIFYTAAGGTSGGTPPTHSTGDASDGGVTWTFVDYAYGAPIGIQGTAIYDTTPDGQGVWAGHFLSVRKSGGGTTYGLEIDVLNRGTAVTNTPYDISPAGSTIALWIAAGYDVLASSNDATCAILIGQSDASFKKGIVFESDGIASGGYAIAMAETQQVGWFASDGIGATIISNVGATANKVVLQFDDNIVRVLGAGNNTLGTFENVASSVNYLRHFPATTGSAPELRAGGTDTDINLKLAGKGTGKLQFGTHSALAAETVSGYITIVDAGGTTRKLAVVS